MQFLAHLACTTARRVCLLSQAGLIRSGEIVGDSLRYLAGGGPLGAALEGDDEGDALKLFRAVAEHRVEYPAFAVTDSQEHRLVPARAPLVLGREGGGQHGEVLKTITS